MKKLVLILLLLLLAPTMVSAFSFRSLLFWRKTQSERQEIAPITEQTKISAQEKYQNWRQAYDSNNVELLLSQPQNLILSEAEANYILSQELEKMKKPPIKNVKVFFREGYLEAKGYLLEPITGSVVIWVKPIKVGGKIRPYVTKARYRGLYIPKFIINKYLMKDLDYTLEFLEEREDFDVIITDGQLELKL